MNTRELQLEPSDLQNVQWLSDFPSGDSDTNTARAVLRLEGGSVYRGSVRIGTNNTVIEVNGNGEYERANGVTDLLATSSKES